MESSQKWPETKRAEKTAQSLVNGVGTREHRPVLAGEASSLQVVADPGYVLKHTDSKPITCLDCGNIMG
jgi:hypothetical protein